MTGGTRVVGVCGFGPMGAAVAERLRAGGVRVLTCDPVERSAATRARVASSGVETVASLEALVAQVDVLVSIMGSAAAVRFADELERAVDAAGRDGLVFAECNLVAPDDVVAIAERLGRRGVRVVDAGIVGPPPAQDHAPTVYASGPHAGELAFLADHGFDVRDLASPVGAASALKVCSAAVWQGALALVSEVADAATRYGVGDWLLQDLDRHQELIYRWFAPALVEAVPRAGRWAADMTVVSRSMAAVGADGRYHEAAGAHYARMGTLEDVPGRTFVDVIAAMAGRPDTQEEDR